MVPMYHYTNKQGLEAIKKHGYIAESNDTVKDSAFGFGVYLTHLSQEVDKITVAKNCWSHGYESAIKQGKLDYVILIEIPFQEIECFRDDKRIVYLYSGQLVLRQYRHAFIKCNWGNDKNDNSDNSGAIALGVGVATGIVALLGIAAVKAMK